MLSAGTREGLIIQALKNIGKDHIDKKMHVGIAKLLKDSTEEEIRKKHEIRSCLDKNSCF